MRNSGFRINKLITRNLKKNDKSWRQADQLRDYGCDSSVCCVVEMWLERGVMEDIWQEILIRRDIGQREVELKIENLVTDFRFIKFEMTVGSWNRPNGYIYIYIYIYFFFFFPPPLSIIINEGEAEVKLRVYAVGLSRDRRSKSHWML